ncbi:MAG: hypothetical protein V4622_03780 [Bacteroidota bacterium]
MEELIEIVTKFKENRNFTEIIPQILANKKLSEDLFLMVQTKMEYPFAEHASWIMIHLCQENPSFVQKHEKRLIDILFDTNNQTVLRNIVNILNQLELTDYRESELIDLLVDFILDKKNKVALHVYSIYLLIKFIKKYPELKVEIDSVLELKNENASPAYKVAVRNYHTITSKLDF